MDRQDGEVISEITAFIESWQENSNAMRDCFIRIFEEISTLSGVTLRFVARPGVSYSMRPCHAAQQERDLFAIIDVIDDDPRDRWLSICFYEDMITDPDGRGELIPGGLAGSDGYCFDLYENDDESIAYIISKIKEAAGAAAL